jgi:hypothetical protein
MVMTDQKKAKPIASHTLEVRHVASGEFLDLRGFIADYVQATGSLKHWKIESNVVSFNSEPENKGKEGAFVGYRNAGYFVHDPTTENYFSDKASSFWKTLLANKRYRIPHIVRFGSRKKVFLPSDQEFEELGSGVYERLFSEVFRDTMSALSPDPAFVLEMVDDEFQVRIQGGAVKKDQMTGYMGFEDERLESSGFYLDLDYSKTEGVDADKVGVLLKRAERLCNSRIESLIGILVPQ